MVSKGAADWRFSKTVGFSDVGIKKKLTDIGFGFSGYG